ncbi:MAG: HAMP domain-containing protein [Alphaproteobacteria bacterium]|nr:HAMP domain-containing protein [Alphaproteobacteria bacterium]
MSVTSSSPTRSLDMRLRVHPFRALKRLLPRGLFGRSLIIIVAPVVILQAIISYFFFERHLDKTTQRMATVVAADVAFLINLEDTSAQEERPVLRDKAERMLRYQIRFYPGAHIPAPRHPDRRQSTIDQALDQVIAEQIGGQRHFQVGRQGQLMDIRVEVHDGVLRLLVPRDRVTVSSPDIFIVWLVGASIILVGIAIVFLRNQVRPIERLALAAESFGKGRSVPDFKPYGATEVRSAAKAFLTMRERIDRYVQQRTDMLAGISHDLKTPLTRLKLQLALMEETADVAALRADIDDMERMLNEYLEFARGEGGEKPAATDIATLLQEAAGDALRAQKAGENRLQIAVSEPVTLTVKRNALKRCIANLIDNALKYAPHADIALVRRPAAAEIIVDDDGAGIPESRREEAFRPFHRLDEGRNLQAGGVGLGLAIARDIARAHGGELTLGASPKGGLRATVRLPV